MFKTNSLRESMLHGCRWCQANPEKFTIFVESGNIETTGETPSFVYRYQMVMFVMDYAGELDDLTLPLLAWLSENQPQLLLNPERNQDIKFSAVINDDDSADLLFTLPPAGTRSHHAQQSGHTAGRTPAGAKTPPAIFRRRLVACIPGCDVG
ncbi:Phage tail completion protein R [Escherichia coli]|nr:Phage tail completion protein R [Escherichia coli]